MNFFHDCNNWWAWLDSLYVVVWYLIGSLFCEYYATETNALAIRDHAPTFNFAGFIEPAYSCIRLYTIGHHTSSQILQYVQHVGGNVESSCIMACIGAPTLAVSRHVL